MSERWKREGIEVGEGATCLGCRLVSCATDTPGYVVYFFGYEWHRASGMSWCAKKWAWRAKIFELNVRCFELNGEWNELRERCFKLRGGFGGGSIYRYYASKGRGGCKIPPIIVYKTYILYKIGVFFWSITEVFCYTFYRTTPTPTYILPFQSHNRHCIPYVKFY